VGVTVGVTTIGGGTSVHVAVTVGRGVLVIGVDRVAAGVGLMESAGGCVALMTGGIGVSVGSGAFKFSTQRKPIQA
jgi:hypothetical protein